MASPSTHSGAVAHTSDGEERPNVAPLDATPILPIYFTIGENARVGVLYAIGNALKNAGASINIISQFSAYPHSGITRRINDLITAANALGAVQQPPASGPFKTYVSIDYNAFTSIINSLVAGINALGLPSVTAPPVASATNLSVAGAGVASVTNGTWSNSPTSYTYQWMRGGTAIAGATTNSHTLVAADIGFTLTCVVTAHVAAGVGTATSNAVGPVVA